MIFITVGTHEQPFNRLLIEIDRLIDEGKIKDDVFAQIGYSDYLPHSFKFEKFLSYSEMIENFKKADIIITHGGPSSFMDAIKLKKIPIVVPRQKDFNEHINNHQLVFAKELKSRNFPIIVVEDISKLNEAIESLSKADLEKFEFNYNNSEFVNKFEEECRKLFVEK